MKKYCRELRVTSIEHLSTKHVLLKLTQNEQFPVMYPGQFVQIRVRKSSSTFLRRPISINYVDVNTNEMWLLIAVVGEGTYQLSQLSVGDYVDCMFPLGQGFSIAPSFSHKRILLVGGGVGVAPLFFQGKRIADIGGCPIFLLGARTLDDIMELDFFKEIGDVYITTEDGSGGEQGYVTNHSVLGMQNFDFIQTCGPKPMMVAISRYAKERGIEGEASLENLMACGIGACLCCVEKIVDGNVCVCTEGPVFNINGLLW